jgi:hypothetical protein
MTNHRATDCKIEILTDYLAITGDMLSALIMTAIEHASIRKSGRPDEWVKISAAELNRLFFNTQSTRTIHRKMSELQKMQYISSKKRKDGWNSYKINTNTITPEIQEKTRRTDYAELASAYSKHGVFYHIESKTPSEEMEEIMERMEVEMAIDKYERGLGPDPYSPESSKFKTTKFFDRIIEMENQEEIEELERIIFGSRRM